MTEIDFDELDKAVNTLMGSKAVPQPKDDDQAEESTMPADEVAQPADTDMHEEEAPSADEALPAVVEPDTPSETSFSDLPSLSGEASVSETSHEEEPLTPEAEASTTASVPTRPASIATKRRGQFMDVMHPSANMKSAATRAPSAVSQVSRHGVTLAPSRNVTPEVTPPARALATSTTISAPAAPDWPDPIELAQGEQEPATVAPQPVLTPDPVEIETTAESDAPAEPLSSPFLPDAKVEKRPLGEAQPTGLSEPTDTPEPTPAVEDEGAPLPVELSGGVLAVESSELAGESKPETPAPEPTPPRPEKPESPVASEPSEPVGPTSIPPQYKAANAKDESDEHSALYDTVSVAPAATPPKKKNGWLVPIAIIGLIVLGCAGGVFVYYHLRG